MPNRLSFAAALLFALPLAAQRHPAKPVGLIDSGVVHRGTLPDATVKIPALRAVMLGGNVDGPEGPSTKSYRAYLTRVAAVLRARGVTVTEIYKSTSTDAIRAAVKGAHFIFYAGHGIGSSDAPKYEGKVVPAGMLVVDEVWSNEKDVSAWEPAPGAIVFYLGACFTAGNSGDDIGKIGDAEAKRRVSVYSQPFFKNKFGGYYAAWSDSQAQSVMANLFAGHTLGKSYDPEGDLKGVFKSAHPLSPGNDLWYHRSQRGSGFAYDYAFVGKPGVTLQQLFAGQSEPVTPSKPSTIEAETSRQYGTLVIRAIYAGDEAEAKRLLAAGADTTVRYSDWTQLMLAVYYDRPGIVAALIETKADLNATMDGWSALSLASAYERKGIVDALRAAGARTDRAMPGKLQPPPVKSK